MNKKETIGLVLSLTLFMAAGLYLGYQLGYSNGQQISKSKICIEPVSYNQGTEIINDLFYVNHQVLTAILKINVTMTFPNGHSEPNNVMESGDTILLRGFGDSFGYPITIEACRL